ncbi:MAG: hypothetical protein ABI811_19510 [Acidobacteriota bacterium]
MRFTNSISAAALCLCLSFVALGQVTKQVDCSKGKSINDAIAKLDADKEYIVEVSGTCTENVVIANFEGISLQIVGTPSAIINGVDTSPILVPVISVSSSRRVRLANLNVNPIPNSMPPASPPNGNASGISMSACRGCLVDAVTVNADRLGILWIQSQGGQLNSTVVVNGVGTATAVANSSDVTLANYAASGNLVQRSFAGLNVDGGSRVRLSYNAVKQIQHFTYGIKVANASSVEGAGVCGLPATPQACLEILDNTWGLRATSAQATVMSGVTFDANGDGVWVENGGVTSLGPLVNITHSMGGFGAAGNGITLTHNSQGSIAAYSPGGVLPPNNITNNTRRGISVATSSSLQFTGLAGSNMNNVTANIAPDIACDATSVLTGTNTLPAATVIACTNKDPAPIPLP